MKQEELQKELNKFRDYVVKKAKYNLVRQRKISTKSLYNSIQGNVKAMPNSFSMNFEMEEYGFYQDKGVKGKSSSTKAPSSPFRFGSGSGAKGGLTKGIQKWVKKKRFQFNDKKTGKFLSYDSTAFLISRSIYQKGIKSSLFFTKPFEAAYKNLPGDLVEAFGLDAIKLFNTTTFPKQK
jgi:hypothetical protein